MKKKVYYYKKSSFYLTNRFPFIHRTTWKNYVHPVEADRFSRFPKNVEEIEIWDLIYLAGKEIGLSDEEAIKASIKK